MSESELYDVSGQLRRPGTWVPPEGFVSSLPPYVGEPESPLWDDSDIKKALSASDRRRCEEIFDARYWIRNQGSYSSCNGYATAAALSRVRYLRGIQDNLILSGSFIYSLINGGRDQGSMLEDSLRVVQTHGAPPESLVGQSMIYPRLQPSNAKQEALKHLGFVAYRTDTKQAWRTALAAGYIGVAVVQAGRNFNKMSPLNTGTSCAVRGGVDRGSGNHAICISDMRIIGGEEYYLNDNSWSTSGYGSLGRAWLPWDSFEECWKYHDFFVIASSQEN